MWRLALIGIAWALWGWMSESNRRSQREFREQHRRWDREEAEERVEDRIREEFRRREISQKEEQGSKSPVKTPGGRVHEPKGVARDLYFFDEPSGTWKLKKK